jgi:polyisoprenoid-binding protein YceI
MALPIWNLDPVHSIIGLSVRHLMVAKVHGTFSRWSASLAFDETAPSASQVEVEIDAASIDTKDPQRDAHLRSADFLEVDKYPHIRFRMTSIAPLEPGHFRIIGDLSIRGTTRAVALEVEYAGRIKDPWGNDRVGFSVRGSINRKDFGLVWNQVLEAGGVAVADRVDISVELEAVRAVVVQAQAV